MANLENHKNAGLEESVEKNSEKQDVCCEGKLAQYIPENGNIIKACHYTLQELKNKTCEYLGKLKCFGDLSLKECLYGNSEIIAEKAIQ